MTDIESNIGIHKEIDGERKKVFDNMRSNNSSCSIDRANTIDISSSLYQSSSPFD